MFDCLGFTSNKCIEGLLGMALTVAREDSREAGTGRAASWSLDLADVHHHGERLGPSSDRFTPTAQAVAAFAVALDQLDAEGKQSARLARYTANLRVIYDGMIGFGLRPCHPSAMQGPIVVNVAAAADAAWNLQAFVDQLKACGVLISNFYNTPEPSCRIGYIGVITPREIRDVVQTFGAALMALGLQSRKAA